MSDLERRGSYVPRRTREKRAFRLVLAAGGLGAFAAVGLVLAFVGVIGAGLPILAAVLAAICGFLFWRTVS